MTAEAFEAVSAGRPYGVSGRCYEGGPLISYAQTRIQLFNDLIRQGRSGGELVRIRESYHLATILFSGLVRPSGKTFIDHAVATASILATLDARIETVAAGLLHAAYTHGDFGALTGGMSLANRREVRQAIGKEAERLVAKYTMVKWNSQTIPIYHQRLSTLGPDEREVLLIRLANELDDHLQLGVLYCSDAELRRDFAVECGPRVLAMAAELGYPHLSAELKRAYRETEMGTVPPELRHSGGRTRVHRIAPRSYCRMRTAIAWDIIRRGLKRFSNSAGFRFFYGQSDMD